MRNLQILGFIIVLQIMAFAQTTDSLVSISHYEKDGLEIGCLLVKGLGVFDDWKKPETPVLRNTSEYQRGDTIVTVIVIGTDGKNEEGNADVTYDITIYKPDGSVYGDFKQLDLWKHAPAPVLELVQQPIVIKIENNDPFGIYKIAIRVYENNLKKQVDFNLTFLVQS